jgi:tetratricopeptide (TPR) repeat protein
MPRPGELLTNLPLSDTDPESTVPTEEQRNKDPLQFGYWLQDALMKGDHAWKEKNFALAVKFYRAVAKAVPDRSVAFSKMCDAYEAMGDRDKAIASCLSALFVEGVRFSDYARYVRLVLSQPTGLTDGQISALDTVLTQFKADPKAHPLVDQLECEVGTRTSNLSYLDECTRELLARTPNDPGIIPFQFAIALRRGDFAAARQFADRAKEAGSSAEGLEGMQQALDLATRRRTRGVALWAGMAFLLLLGLGMGGAYFVKRRAAPPEAQPA